MMERQTQNGKVSMNSFFINTICYLSIYLSIYFEAGSHYVAQTGLKIMTPPKY